MKITVGQLKQLIREQVEEMGLPEKYRSQAKKQTIRELMKAGFDTLSAEDLVQTISEQLEGALPHVGTWLFSRNLKKVRIPTENGAYELERDGGEWVIEGPF